MSIYNNSCSVSAIVLNVKNSMNVNFTISTWNLEDCIFSFVNKNFIFVQFFMFEYICIKPFGVPILLVELECILIIARDFVTIFLFGFEMKQTELSLFDEAFNKFLSLLISLELFPTGFIK